MTLFNFCFVFIPYQYFHIVFQMPNVICLVGALLVMMSVIGIAVEEKLTANRAAANSNPYESI